MNQYTDPSQHFFWLASRATGVTALILIAVSTTMGLFLSGRFAKRPGAPGWIKIAHEAIAIDAIILIVLHAGFLLGDNYLHPTLAQITIPFLLPYHTITVGLGIIAAWLAIIFTGSFYVRKWITNNVWRYLHRFTLLVYILAVIHVIGAGTDAHSIWLIAIMIIFTIPLIFALIFRFTPREKAKNL